MCSKSYQFTFQVLETRTERKKNIFQVSTIRRIHRLTAIRMNAKRKIYFCLILLIGFVGYCSSQVIKTKVAILGGEMAGVIAGRTLSENGISDFLIIEAESVLGGRMKETKCGGYTIELGAT
jgi:hypothetical protein